MYTVTKELYFCYGHRLMNHGGKCRHLHGHSVKASITIGAEKLNEDGMVCDFADIRNSGEDYINRHLDHNLLLYREDPLIPALEAGGERFRALDEHPTAEVLAKEIFMAVKNAGLGVIEVTLWETASSYATYRP
mgnify:FL=1